MQRYLFLFALCAASSALFAQPVMDPLSEGKRLMSLGTNPSFLLEMPDVDRDEAVTAWESYIKPYRGKTKYNRKAKEYVTTGASIPSLGGTVDLYAKITDGNNKLGSTVIVWVQTPDGFAGAEGSTQYAAAARSWMERYALTTSKAHSELLLRNEQELLNKREKELRDLHKEKEKLQKDIRQAEKLIADSQKKLEVNALDTEQAETAIVQQKQAVQRAETRAKQYGN